LRGAAKNYLPAIVCPLTLLACYFLIRPYAEIGMEDDWSYIKTAYVLAQTGHIVYNGWATAMLGWQLYAGALFVKLCGFSFTAVRFASVIEAMVTAYLLQRTFTLAGLNSWNATLATMTFVFSPVYFSYAFTFMSDVSGVLCVVVCLYLCLRAVQAESERSAMAWIVLAALVNAVGGTARQIAWLGLLVMVPCTLWLLRKSRRVLVAGCISWIVGVVMIAAAMHWFARQPYSISVSWPHSDQASPLSGTMNAEALSILGRTCLRAIGYLALLALPVLLMFAGSFRSWNRRAGAAFAAGVFCFAVPGIALIRAGKLHDWLAPFLSDYMTDSAFEKLSAITVPGSQPAIARGSLGVLLTVAVVVGILSLVALLFAGARGRLAPKPSAATISWRQFWIIAGPFSAATIALLMLIMSSFGFSDRYLLPLLMILLIVLARNYQDRVKAKLPLACALLIAIFGGFSIAATHDAFALHRGYVTAADEIESHGVSATAILGPWELEGWTQIEKAGYINDDRIRIPAGAYMPPAAGSFPKDCEPQSAEFMDVWSVGFLDRTPVIQPVYATFLDRRACGGQVAFPPVMYRTWIAPHTNWIYPVRLPPSFSH
jgi:hypothetical protein